MNELNYKELYDKLLLENNKLLLENQELKNHLKKYTSPKSYKNYYEKNKEQIIEKAKEYRTKTNYHKNIPDDKLKEYRKRAYEKRKIKLSITSLENINLENVL